jgi:hypothetical protein
MTNEQKVRKAVRKEIKQTIKEDNIAVDLVNWLTKKMGIAIEKRAMKKLANDKVLQKSLSQLHDKLKDLGPDSPAMQRLKKSLGN